MSARWFLNYGNNISGPFSEEEVENRLPGMPDAFIWAKGLSEWIPVSEWPNIRQQLPHLLNTAAEPRWRYRVDGTEYGPMFFKDLIASLHEIPQLESVEVISDNHADWRNVYHVQAVVDELGITRRAHARVPIMGILSIEEPQKMDFRIVSISEGGLGINGAENFRLGESYKGLIKSQNLGINIPCRFEVVYIAPDGYAGLRFTSLSSEGRGVIVEYVRKFKDIEP
ncbi:MAG: PilZ domain-containing protein [Bdellovibrionaceae bacterium]|nr:PilZ domain-containing protein [Pseudobdellovibrionaceae bacterium]